mmetsp:Transcript_10399/g.14263  ORF Transcript_10399/g.14263 Transcript_10399/m.14263 type:complete len:278 (-) Transcript_10399:22-855(-)
MNLAALMNPYPQPFQNNIHSPPQRTQHEYKNELTVSECKKDTERSCKIVLQSCAKQSTDLNQLSKLLLQEFKNMHLQAQYDQELPDYSKKRKFTALQLTDNSSSVEKANTSTQIINKKYKVCDKEGRMDQNYPMCLEVKESFTTTTSHAKMSIHNLITSVPSSSSFTSTPSTTTSTSICWTLKTEQLPRNLTEQKKQIHNSYEQNLTCNLENIPNGNLPTTNMDAEKLWISMQYQKKLNTQRKATRKKARMIAKLGVTWFKLPLQVRELTDLFDDKQ